MKRPSSDADQAPLAVTQGDPAGVGPLASLQVWQTLKSEPGHAFYLRGSPELLHRYSRLFSINTPVIEIAEPLEAAKAFVSGLPVIPLETPHIEPGKPIVEAAPSILTSIELCVDDVVNGKASAVVTNPIAKSLLKSSGFPHPGHTEYLSELLSRFTGREPPLPVMMLIGGGLRVALATIHIPLMRVGDVLSSDLIRTVSDIVLSSLKTDFGCETPRLALCGLNPHAGEDGMLGSEDRDMIEPVVAALKASGETVYGPRPGDTVFHEMLEGRYDGVIAMYHDQGLIPVKTLDIWGGVNATLGLPFIRTSPDHGTAYDAAAAGTVNPNSLIAAIKQARLMSANRQKAEQNV
ncbi:MAG: 4-hydroxythreonine-4-phosphate dehydrogenase PdxA [Ponticaulis sp.]|nr:4-hydroxythreonine-4-phosphate dehydrogenase PdxA [Ponticaulis sp.]